MPRSEHTEADVSASTVALRRVAVYLVATVVLLVVVWSLIEGGDRDLWTTPSALLRAPTRFLLP